MANLFDAVHTFDASQAKTVREYSGILGLPTTTKTVAVPNRNGYVYVRLRDNQNEVIQAYNEEVSAVWNLPVIIIRKAGGWYIKGRDIERYSNWGSDSAFIPAHATQHEFNRDSLGGDVVFVYSDAFLPLAVTPSGTGAGNVVIQPMMLKKTDDTWAWVGNTGTQNLLGFKPTDNQALLGVVYVDKETGNPGFVMNSGSPFSASITGSGGLVPYIPDLPSSNYEPLYGVRLLSGTVTIQYANLYDIRQFYGGSGGTGTGGGIPEAPIDGLVYGRKDAGWTEVSGTSGGTPTFDANRVVITDDSGNQTVDDHFYYDFDANVLILGSTDAALPGAGTNAFHLVGSGTSPLWALWAFGTGVAGFNTFFAANGDWTTPTALTHGKVIGRPARFRGHDGVGWTATQAEIRGQARGLWSTSSQGTDIVVAITPSGTTSMVDMLQVRQDGTDLLYGTYNISGSPHLHDYIAISGNVSQANLEELTDGSTTTLHYHTVPSILFAHGSNGQVPASTTYYISPPFTALGVTAFNVPLPKAGILKNLYVRAANQPATGSLVITLMVNSVATALVATVPAGAGAGTYSDTFNLVSVNASDAIVLRVVNNATSASALTGGISVEYDIANT